MKSVLSGNIRSSPAPRAQSAPSQTPSPGCVYLVIVCVLYVLAVIAVGMYALCLHV